MLEHCFCYAQLDSACAELRLLKPVAAAADCSLILVAGSVQRSETVPATAPALLGRPDSIVSEFASMGVGLSAFSYQRTLISYDRLQAP